MTDSRIRQFASPVIAITSEKTLQHCLFEMEKNGVRRLAVVNKVYPIGVISERDIVTFLETDPKQRSLNQVLVSEVMNRNLVKIVAGVENFLQECAMKMISLDVGSVLVIDEDDQLVGMTTKSTLVENYPLLYRGMYKVRKFCNASPVTARETDVLHWAFLILRRNHVSRIIITNSSGNPVGILSYKDFLQFNQNTENYLLYHEYLKPEKSEVTVSQIMQKPVISVDLEDDVAVAAKIMMEYKISGVPVVFGNGYLYGVITSTDICKIFSQY